MDALCLKMSVLTDENFEGLKKTVERAMQEVGFAINNLTILEAFKKAGAKVDFEKMRVRIAPELLWGLVGLAPGSYRVAGMNGDAYEIGGGSVYKAAIVTDPFIADYPSGNMRKPRLRDVELNTRIIQSQPDVCQVSLMDYPVEDVDGPSSRYRAQEAHLLNHAKHYSVWATSYESFMEWMEVGNIISRGRPLKNSGLFSSAIAVLSPLTLTRDNCDILLESLKHGFPLIPTVCPMAGSTAPYTFAGTLVQGIAENLIVLCSAQLLNPGNPFAFLFSPSVTEMRKGRTLFYTVDKALWKIAAAEFAKRLGLPVHMETGGALNSRYDMQGGAEGMLMSLSALLSGADILAGSGSCLNAEGLSAEHILTHYSFLAAAEHMKKGYSCAELEKNLDSIREQGPRGNYLGDSLTLELLRNPEFFSHPLFDESGETGGGMPMLERAHEEALRIDKDFVSPVPEDIADGLRSYFGKKCRDL